MYCVKMQGWFQQWSFLDSQRWYPKFWIVRKTLHVNSFFFDFLAKKIKWSIKIDQKYLYLSHFSVCVFLFFSISLSSYIYVFLSFSIFLYASLSFSIFFHFYFFLSLSIFVQWFNPRLIIFHLTLTIFFKLLHLWPLLV
jgi:hypothetical protein